MLAVLEQRAFPVADLRLFASSRSVGQRLPFRGSAVPVQALDDAALRGVDVALFAAGSALAREWAPRAVAAGAVVIDNSSAFRLQDDVPLVVPEVNAAALRGHRGIVANPNCSTILLAVVVWPLHQVAGLRAVVVSTYQAASGAGQGGIAELRAGLAAQLAGTPLPVPQALPQPLAGNVFPQVDVFQPDGYTREEDKLRLELRKITGLAELPVEATCVRVPVERCHSESVVCSFARELTPAAARARLAAAPGVEVVDAPEQRRYPMPLHASGGDAVAVGRVRTSRVFAPGLALWLCGDQLRKGAALNAVQIAERL
jgi:aspartate-semialdehyde dehydrogenase